MLDSDLAILYGVETKVLIQAVRRNIERFPEDFMFQLRKSEYEDLRSQFVTLKKGRGKHRKYLPYAFTEQVAIIAASVLNSERAVEISVYVVRAFVKLRKILATYKELAMKLNELENKLTEHDKAILMLMDAIKHLMEPAKPKNKKPIGFVAD